ncbi:interferon-induced, double-stranded RNA-activated protein kinase-like isoform X3 [Ascaphus truei]|uniref:interferon-induced, double-stranded RNA-activated protein kinase-like isoform X3 n=1 Tax=Ascaphus truei TaxID=8439 RepID=UPI003F5A3AE6
MQNLNYKGHLITYCVCNNMNPDFREVLVTGPPHDPTFTYHVFINGEKLGEGQDNTKKKAENIAAKMALEALQNQENQNSPAGRPQLPETPPPAVSKIPAASSSSSSSSSSSPAESENLGYYISQINMYAQERKIKWEFVFTSTSGVDHLPVFTIRCIIGDRKFKEGTGQNKKIAKGIAAKLAWEEICGIFSKARAKLEEPGAENSSVSKSGTGDINSDTWSTENGMAAHEKPTDNEKSPLPSTNMIPSAPKRTPRKGPALAANFSNRVQASNPCTVDIIFLQHFDDITNLALGGFGTVFKARKILDKKYYVVKKVKQKGTKSIAEVQALAHFEHTNIVRYYHSWTGLDYYSETDSSTFSDKNGVKEECLFIQMEYCPFGTLRSWIDKIENVDKKKCLEIFRQIIEGLVYIHDQKLIHRDVKPSNIFFAEELKIKIGDFGLVVPMTGKHEEQEVLRTGRGTRSYMAPEQKETIYENEVDIFPLGLILFELLWKCTYFCETQKEWNNIRNAQFPKEFVEQYPAEASKIKSMLSEDPKKRPKASDLKNFFAERSPCQSFLPDFDDISYLASGGFGTVYKARKILDEKYYVVKKVKRLNEKTVVEVQTLARLQHENIVRYYHSWTGVDSFGVGSSGVGSSGVGSSGVGSSGVDYSEIVSSNSSEKNEVKGKCLFIQMEYCPLGTLRSWIDKMEMVDRNKSLEIFRQIIEGVVYIHSQNLIHRDLKPLNIFFAEELKIKIGDFGFVVPMTGEHEEQEVLRTVRGTRSYMAPEQKESTFGNEVDIFPLGLILLELLWKFNTTHEKIVEWENIRIAKFPKMFAEKYPVEESMMKLMLSEDRNKRPKTSALKNYFAESSFLYSKTC